MASVRAVMAASFIRCTTMTTRIVFPVKFIPKLTFNPGLPTTLYSNIQGARLGPRLDKSREFCIMTSAWKSERSPYETLEMNRDVNEEEIKASYRRLAKYYHPDGVGHVTITLTTHSKFGGSTCYGHWNITESKFIVTQDNVYDGTGDLEEGETAEARFIKIQAAYELLMNKEQRMQYDRDNRANPAKASKAWMEWLMKKKKAFEKRGDLAVAAWAEQQQLELNLRVRRLSRSKNDPDEMRKILARESRASEVNFSNTMKRHTLVLKKRDIMRKKAEEDRKKTFQQLLASEGLELDSDEEDKT